MRLPNVRECFLLMGLVLATQIAHLSEPSPAERPHDAYKGYTPKRTIVVSANECIDIDNVHKYIKPGDEVVLQSGSYVSQYEEPLWIVVRPGYVYEHRDAIDVNEAEVSWKFENKGKKNIQIKVRNKEQLSTNQSIAPSIPKTNRKDNG